MMMGWDLPPPHAARIKAMDAAMPPLAHLLQSKTKLTMTTRMADDATRGEGRTTMTSNESGRWITQGDNNGGNDDSGDVVAPAVTRAGVGWHEESGRGRRRTR
jgi:hypothetical protein